MVVNQAAIATRHGISLDLASPHRPVLSPRFGRARTRARAAVVGLSLASMLAILAGAVPAAADTGLQTQAPLVVTSTRGEVGTMLLFTTSGGSGSGAVSFSVVNGSSSGCGQTADAIGTTSPGTCIVTATKASDGTYSSATSVPTSVSFSATAPSPPLGLTTGTPAILASGVLQDDNGPNQIYGQGASYIAVDSNDDVYVPDALNGTIIKVAPDGTQTVVASGFPDPVGVAVDSAGDVYVTDDQLDSLTKVTPSGSQTTVASLVHPSGVAVDSAGNVYVGDDLVFPPYDGNGIDTGAVYEYNPAGTLIRSFNYFENPTGIAVDSYGNVFVADDHAHGGGFYSLWEIFADGSGGGFGPNAWVHPAGVAVDLDDNVFANDFVYYGGPLEVTPTSVTSITGLDGGGFVSQTGVAVDNAETVFVADSGDGDLYSIASVPTASQV